jgi:hypothetical protein
LNLFILAGLLFATFVAAAVALAFWASRLTHQAPTRDDREILLALASRAATDESGKTLVMLLDVLDGPAADGPVSVAWVRHVPAKGNSGMLLKITWDGNEWRRIYPVQDLLALVRAQNSQGLLASKLVADLEAAARLPL